VLAQTPAEFLLLFMPYGVDSLMSSSIKSRLTLVHTNLGTVDTYVNNNLVTHEVLDSRGYQFQRTSSSGHPFRSAMRQRGSERNDILKRHGLLDLGGIFDTASVTMQMGGTRTFVDTGAGGSTRRVFNGELYAWRSNLLTNTTGWLLPPSSDAILNAFGTHAIAVTIPTNPLAGMGVFLGELRDLPKIPMMDTIRNLKTQINGFRKIAGRKKLRRLSDEAAGEYLNGVFGWAPFVSDLKKFCKVVKHHERYIDQFRKGSGTLIRRRFTEPESISTVVTNLGLNYGEPVLVSPFYTKRGTLLKTSTTKSQKWFSGAYTYYLPKVDTFVGRLREAEALESHLYGLRLTPDLLYKLAPWSWALDWVTNTGDIIHNWSAFANDGLVLQYGYVMETKTVTDQYVLSDLTLVGKPPLTLTQTLVQETKCRRKATPYGFGLNTSGFTPKQWSIIAALGISRAPRSLNF